MIIVKEDGKLTIKVRVHKIEQDKEDIRVYKYANSEPITIKQPLELRQEGKYLYLYLDYHANLHLIAEKWRSIIEKFEPLLDESCIMLDDSPSSQNDLSICLNGDSNVVEIQQNKVIINGVEITYDGGILLENEQDCLMVTLH